MSEPLLVRHGYRHNRLTFQAQVDNEVVIATFFNQPYIKKQIKLNQQVVVMGKWGISRCQITENELLKEKADGRNEFSAAYAANKHIWQNVLQSFIRQACEEYINIIPTYLPEAARQRYRLVGR